MVSENLGKETSVLLEATNVKGERHERRFVLSVLEEHYLLTSKLVFIVFAANAFRHCRFGCLYLFHNVNILFIGNQYSPRGCANSVDRFFAILLQARRDSDRDISLVYVPLVAEGAAATTSDGCRTDGCLRGHAAAADRHSSRQ